MRIKNNIAKMIKHFSGSSVQMEITVPHNVQLRILMALGNPGKFASKLLFTYLWPSCTPQKCQKEGGAQSPHPLSFPARLLPPWNISIEYMAYIDAHIHVQIVCMYVWPLFAVWNIFNLTLGRGALAALAALAAQAARPSQEQQQ